MRLGRRLGGVLGRLPLNFVRIAQRNLELCFPEKTPAERAMVIHVEAFDWNCPQHITPRYTVEELAGTLEPLRKRMEALEAENARLRTLIGETAAKA